MFSRTNFLNHETWVSILELPAVRNSNKYSPDSFVLTEDWTPVPVLMRTTCAPGTTAPVGSLAVPRILAVFVWPDSRGQKTAKSSAPENATWRFVIHIGLKNTTVTRNLQGKSHVNS